MRNILKEKFNKWVSDLLASFRKNPLRSFLLVLISPVLIYLIAAKLDNFGIITTIGYYAACIYGLSRIIEDPLRIVKWGIGYAIGSIAVKLLFNTFWPNIKEHTYGSILLGLIILYIVIIIWFKSRDLKKS